MSLKSIINEDPTYTYNFQGHILPYNIYLDNNVIMTGLTSVELSNSVPCVYIWQPLWGLVKLAWATQLYTTINLLSYHGGKGSL